MLLLGVDVLCFLFGGVGEGRGGGGRGGGCVQYRLCEKETRNRKKKNHSVDSGNCEYSFVSPACKIRVVCFPQGKLAFPRESRYPCVGSRDEQPLQQGGGG